MKIMKQITVILALLIASSGVVAQETKDVDDSSFFTLVETMPEYKGGESALLSWIGKNVEYPKKAKKKRIEGVVYVSYIVDVDGKVVDVRVVRGVHKLLNKAAVKCIKKLSGYTPGRQKGKPVKVQFTIPIRFKMT